MHLVCGANEGDDCGVKDNDKKLVLSLLIL